MNISENKIKEKLYKKGLIAFNSHNFYDAHEFWEDLWSDYQLVDAKFIQGLIQLSVGYYHISNYNRNGAIGLLNKCRSKFIEYLPEHRGIKVQNIIDCVDLSLANVKDIPDKNKLNEFDWSLVPKLN